VRTSSRETKKLEEKDSNVTMEGAYSAAAEGHAGDPMVTAAAEEVKTLGGCCKDSDKVLERINGEHEKLSKQGPRRPSPSGPRPRDPGALHPRPC